QTAVALGGEKLWQVIRLCVTDMDVAQHRLEGAHRAHGYLESIRVQRCTGLHGVAQAFGSDTHSVEFCATLWLRDIWGVRLQGLESGAQRLPELAIHIVSWRLGATGLVCSGQLRECLLHLLDESTGNELF